jgi:hypothetical protein
MGVRISTASGSERRLTLTRRSLPLAVLIRLVLPYTQLQTALNMRRNPRVGANSFNIG